jgi:hypothetical protein
LTCYGIYGVAAYDDYVLNINNIPHISQVFDVLNINLPVLSDLTNFVKSKQ